MTQDRQSGNRRVRRGVASEYLDGWAFLQHERQRASEDDRQSLAGGRSRGHDGERSEHVFHLVPDRGERICVGPVAHCG